MKGRLSVDRGYFYDKPNGEISMNWRDLLDFYAERAGLAGYILPQIKINPDKTVLEVALKSFQEKWPGNYIIEEYYNSTKGRLDLRLKFSDPHEETVWLLRWS